MKISLSSESKVMQSPVGRLLLTATSKGLTSLTFIQNKSYPTLKCKNASILHHLNFAHEELLLYFDKKLLTFSVPLDIAGTPFQKRVWGELCKIPYQHTATYKELARRCKNPLAYRAVGSANHKNPIPIIIPCHRVIGSDGSLTGYAGGLSIKKSLLQLEGFSFHSDKLCNDRTI